MILTAEQIKKANDIKTIELNVPEWGGSVKIAEFNVKTRGEFELWVQKNKDNLASMRERLALLVLVDEHGNKLFNEADLPILQGKNGKILDRIFEAACKLNGLFNDGLDKEVKKS